MDFYFILGIERGATLNDVKRAYRRLARRYHPDINPGDRVAAAQFQQIVEAFETLSDPGRRTQYDLRGVVSTDASQAASIGFDGFDFSVSVRGDAASTFGDLFGHVLQERARQQVEGLDERGADLHQTITFSLEDTVRGGARDVVITRRESCRTCRGAGRVAIPGTDCRDCAGTGAVRSARGHMVFSRPCARCGGSGRHAAAPCTACGGLRTETRTEFVTVGVPAGLGDGARIRIAGKGHAGRNGGEAGDLIITIRVEPHPVFRRDGDDLWVMVPLAIHEAALGARIDVPSLDGPVRMRVPPGTQSGQRFRLRERGVPSPRSGQRGDLVVEVRLTLPQLLDERSKELLREFGRINGVERVRADSVK